MAGPRRRDNRIRWYYKGAILALSILLVVLGVFLWRQYVALRRAQILNARELWFTDVLKHHEPLTANDVNIVRPWMTFDYINKVFNLPPDYLKGTLGISDTHYPQISISSYAKESHIDVNTFLASVEAALRDYLSAPAGTAATSTRATSTKSI